MVVGLAGVGGGALHEAAAVEWNRVAKVLAGKWEADAERVFRGLSMLVVVVVVVVVVLLLLLFLMLLLLSLWE